MPPASNDNAPLISMNETVRATSLSRTMINKYRAEGRFPKLCPWVTVASHSCAKKFTAGYKSVLTLAKPPKLHQPSKSSAQPAIAGTTSLCPYADKRPCTHPNSRSYHDQDLNHRPRRLHSN